MTGSAPAPFPHGPGRFPARRGRGEFVKNLSKSVQKRFTYWRAGCGILRMSIREAAIPNRQPTDLLFLFYPPFYFVKCRKRPGSVPPRTGALPCPAGARRICKKPFKVCSRFVHKLACPVQYTVIVGRENTHPSGELLFYTLFSFFHLFFLPSFSFCIGMRPASLPLRKQGVSLCTGQFFQQKQIFHRPFKICSYMGRGNGVY